MRIVAFLLTFTITATHQQQGWLSLIEPPQQQRFSLMSCMIHTSTPSSFMIRISTLTERKQIVYQRWCLCRPRLACYLPPSYPNDMTVPSTRSLRNEWKQFATYNLTAFCPWNVDAGRISYTFDFREFSDFVQTMATIHTFLDRARMFFIESIIWVLQLKQTHTTKTKPTCKGSGCTKKTTRLHQKSLSLQRNPCARVMAVAAAQRKKNQI